MQLSKMPIKVLSNGLRVGNLCSGHDFTFTDGSVLPKCAEDRVNAGRLHPNEVEYHRGSYRREKVEWFDIDLDFEISMERTPVLIEMISQGINIWQEGEVDIILVPYPLLKAMKEASRKNGNKSFTSDDLFRADSPFDHPFRTIRRSGREGDGKGEGRTHINKFCF